MGIPTVTEIRNYLENYCIDTISTYVLTGNITTGSPVITNIATANLRPQMIVNGAGIPVDARILSVDNSMQITLDVNATATTTGVSLTISYYTEISDHWLTMERDNSVIPFCEMVTKQSFTSSSTVTEFYSGNGENTLILDRRPIIEVTDIRYVLGGQNLAVLNLSNIEQIRSLGILKAKRNYEETYYLPVFAKGNNNLKVTYTYGYTNLPNDLKMAVIMLVCSNALGMIGARTGGGSSLSMQSYSRNFGARGMYNDVRVDMEKRSMQILKNYMTSVVGS